MNELKKFYEEARSNAAIKSALLKANEQARKMEPEEIKQEIIRIGAKFGYTISEKDFDRQQDDIDPGDNATISAGCFIVNAGCTLLGEIDQNGGCIILGLY